MTIQDTMLKHHAIIAEKGVPHDLGFIASCYTPIPFYKDDAKGEDNFALLDVDKMRTYNCRDTLVTLIADRAMDPEVDDYGVRHVYENDMAMVPVLLRMIRRGVLINQSLLYKYRSDLEKELADVAADLRACVGDDFNPNSDAQVRKLLFTELGFSPVSFTKARQPSVDFDSLIQISENADESLEPLFTLLIEQRRLSKLLSTYLKEFILDSNGRLHTQYTLHVTPTGRLSSRRPNLQNIPDGLAKELFIAAPGFEFQERDYSQIELRILAELTDDESWLAAFRAGEDVHNYTTADLFSIKHHEVVKWQRDFAKTFTYGAILYGGTAKTVRRQALNRAMRERHKTGRMVVIPSVREIEACQQEFFKKHPGIFAYQRSVEQEIARNGSVRSESGRLRIFLIKADSARRAGYNFPIQEFASHVIRRAMVRLHEALKEPNGMNLQIHDSLLCELEEGRAEELDAEVIKPIMEEPIMFHGRKVVFPTDAKRGHSWGNLKKVA